MKKSGMKILVSGILLVLICSVMLAGCSIFTTERASVKAVVTRTGNLGASSFQSMALDDNDEISFTPTSFSIQVRGLYISENLLFSDGNLHGAGKQISIDNPTPSTWIDLCNGTALSDLFSLTSNVDETKFGDYQAVGLCFGDGSQNAYAKISGTVISHGTNYNITDLLVPIGYTGISLTMPTPVTIDADLDAVVKVIFDLENSLKLVKQPAGIPPGSPMRAAVPGYDDTWVLLDNFILLPYVGADDPVVQKFEVRLDSTDPEFIAEGWADSATWYIKTVTLTDDEGNLVAIGGQEVFNGSNYPSGSEMGVGHFWMPVITENGDGSFNIDHHPFSINFNPGGNLVFPAFQLTSHTGVLVNRGIAYDYTATEL